MKVALDEWNGGADVTHSINAFCKLKGVGRTAFTNRLKGKTAIGASAGRPPLISKKDEQIVVDTLRRLDRGNSGGGVGKAIDLVKELACTVTHKQARDKALNSRKGNSDVLTAPTKAQPTTSKRSQVTLAGQFRWHQVRPWLATWLSLPHFTPQFCVHTPEAHRQRARAATQTEHRRWNWRQIRRRRRPLLGDWRRDMLSCQRWRHCDYRRQGKA